MTDQPSESIASEEELHRWRLGVAMNRIARQKEEINEFQKHVLHEITTNPAKHRHDEVVALQKTIENHAFVRMYVEQMLQEVTPRNYRHFTDVQMMLEAINYVVSTAPIFKDVDSISYQFPLSALMNFWMMTPSGRAVLRMDAMNNHLNRLMKAWCVYLNSKESLYVLNEGPEGWLNEKAQKYNKLDQYVIPDKSAPHWGWSSYNDFFHRDIRTDCRPVDSPHDPAIVCSPNDGVAWALQEDVKKFDSFWLKSQAYSLYNMLNGSPLTERFIGGTVYQTYVNGGADWHRFTAPISGEVLEAEVVEGYAWTESDTISYDPMSGPYSQGWAAGVATRALIFIDSGHEKLGTVCVVPIGLTEVSSVELFTLDGTTRRPLKKGDHVKKGDQLGWFSFGGSSFAMVFQRDALKEILVKPPKKRRNEQPEQTLWANKRFAIANI